MVTESASPAAEPLYGFLSATDGLVNWPLLSEGDYVGKLLEFANTEDAVDLHALQTVLVSGLQLEGQVYFHELQAPLNSTLLALRDRLVRQLETIRADSKRARSDLAEEVKQSAERVAIRPSYELTSKGVRIFYRYFPINLEAAIGHGLLLLLDPSRPYAADLCRCRLPACCRFFMAIKPRTGRPRREYCSEEHLDEALQQDNLARVRRYRARKKTASGRRRRQPVLTRS